MRDFLDHLQVVSGRTPAFMPLHCHLHQPQSSSCSSEASPMCCGLLPATGRGCSWDTVTFRAVTAWLHHDEQPRDHTVTVELASCNTPLAEKQQCPFSSAPAQPRTISLVLLSRDPQNGRGWKGRNSPRNFLSATAHTQLRNTLGLQSLRLACADTHTNGLQPTTPESSQPEARRAARAPEGSPTPRLSASTRC